MQALKWVDGRGRGVGLVQQKLEGPRGGRTKLTTIPISIPIPIPIPIHIADCSFEWLGAQIVSGATRAREQSVAVGSRRLAGRQGGLARMLSMSPFESSDVLSVAFSQNFDFYWLNVVCSFAVCVNLMSLLLQLLQLLPFAVRCSLLAACCCCSCRSISLRVGSVYCRCPAASCRQTTFDSFQCQCVSVTL